MTDYKETLELFYQKRDLLTNMLSLTQSFSFSGVEEDAEIYVNLIESRQSYIRGIIAIEKALGSEPHARILATPPQKLSLKIEQITNEIKEISKQIVDLDNENKKAIEKTYDILKSQVKDFNVSRNIKGLYQKDITPEYNRIDTKK